MSARQFSTNRFDERGHALEEKAVHDHDAKLLADLKKKMEQTKAYGVEQVGTFNTFEWRLFLTQEKKRISAWHDVPLSASPGVFNLVVEMPTGTDEKLEVATNEPLNPIKQDVKNGVLRRIKHGKSRFNYGMLPQTWENPAVKLPGTEYGGDNDPLDVVELGSKKFERGAVVPVKVVGALGLIDEGELDWKLLAINVNDAKAAKINDIADVERELPGVIGEIRDWYRTYKVADGKGENSFAHKGEPLSAAASKKVIDEANAEWRKHKAPKPAKK